MEIQGRIKFIGETQTFGANGFRKRELVLTTDDDSNYPQSIMVEFVQDNVNYLDKHQIGQEVNVAINLRGREWVNPEGVTKYFNSIQGWRIEANQTQQPNQPLQNNVAPAPLPTEGGDGKEEKNLPF